LKSIFTILPQFLKDPQGFYQEVQQNQGLKHKTLALFVSSLVFLIIYGFVTGLSHSFYQGLSTALKMPALFLLTLLFTLPALYFFALALLNVSFSVSQAIVVVLSGIGVSAFLLLGLSPVTLFFVLTSTNYPFFQLLAVVFVAISGVSGLFYILKGFRYVDVNGELSNSSFGTLLLRGWVVLYGFVGAQMTWRLSPLIGDPEMEFFFFRPSRDNFFIDVVSAVQTMLNIPDGERGMVSIIMLVFAAFAGLFIFILYKIFKPEPKPKTAPAPNQGVTPQN